MDRKIYVIRKKARSEHEDRRFKHDEKHHDDIRVESKILSKKGYHKTEFDLPYEQAANALMSAEGYSEYVAKHGYHFTDELAEHVSKMMNNASGDDHSWTAAQVKKAMEAMGWSVPDNVTLGDVTYTANMMYADLYSDPLKTEADCLKAAQKIAGDPDGYKGMVFCRWTADAIGKAISINWKKFI